jgi:serine protease Do
MGAGVQDITPDLAKAFGLKSATGAAITRVEPDSPAEKGGLKAGDVVTAVNGEPVADSAALRLRISRTAPGTPVKLTVEREGGQRELTVTLARLPERGGPASGDEDSPLGEGTGSTLRGLSVDELTPDVVSELQLPRGTTGVVVTRVDRGSSAAEAGLRRGDVITQVGRQPVSSVREFEAAVGRSTGTVLLLVNRGGGSTFVPVQPSR